MATNTSKDLTKYLRTSILCATLLFVLTFPAKASDSAAESSFDPGSMINHHIADAHSWEIYHGLTIYLPVILYSSETGLDIFSSSNFYNDEHEVVPFKGYVLEHEHISLENGGHVIDFSITKNVFFLFLNAGVLVLVFLLN